MNSKNDRLLIAKQLLKYNLVVNTKWIYNLNEKALGNFLSLDFEIPLKYKKEFNELITNINFLNTDYYKKGIEFLIDIINKEAINKINQQRGKQYKKYEEIPDEFIPTIIKNIIPIFIESFKYKYDCTFEISNILDSKTIVGIETIKYLFMAKDKNIYYPILLNDYDKKNYYIYIENIAKITNENNIRFIKMLITNNSTAEILRKNLHKIAKSEIDAIFSFLGTIDESLFELAMNLILEFKMEHISYIFRALDNIYLDEKQEVAQKIYDLSKYAYIDYAIYNNSGEFKYSIGCILDKIAKSRSMEQINRIFKIIETLGIDNYTLIVNLLDKIDLNIPDDKFDNILKCAKNAKTSNDVIELLKLSDDEIKSYNENTLLNKDDIKKLIKQYENKDI